MILATIAASRFGQLQVICWWRPDSWERYTPYATDRSINFPESVNRNSDMMSAPGKWQLPIQIRVALRMPIASD